MSTMDYEGMARSAVGDIGDTGMSVIGLYQILTAEEPDRPTYNTPEEIDEYFNIAKARASQTTMPGYDEILGNIGSTTASAIGTQKESGRYDVSKLYEKQLESMRGLGIANAQSKLDSEAKLKEALKLVAQYKDQAFSWNEAGRYWDEKMDYKAQVQSGFDNLWGGIEGISERESTMSSMTDIGG